MPNIRQVMFPYGMQKNADGSWSFFNRKYKALGTHGEEWSDWEDPKHKMRIKGLGPAKLKKLDIDGKGEGDRIFFYNDATNPERSAENRKIYFEKLAILISLQSGE
ncbi:hypothetical protein VH570_01450 [Sphingobium sp. HT1-2]|uniref:hypothetical protein n=1 Tax=Sphingobium sp. HT1-2 TaxID=3111640 RepID=UPI003C013738